jgi:hypothetical protein
MNKLFSELSVGQQFKAQGSELLYIKTETVKISCCKSINAEEANNPANKTFFSPGTVVVINA